MKNKEMIFDGQRVIPVTGVKRIVHGIKYEAENPETHEKTWVGDGEIVYDVSNDRISPVFALRFKSNNTKGTK